MASASRTFQIPPELENQSLAGALRALAPPLSWSQAKRLIVNRHVLVNGALSLNDARRLRAGETVELHEEPRAPVPRGQDVRLLHVDADLVVVDKPAGVVTLRRDQERDLSEERKALQPTLDELVPLLIPGAARRAAGKDRRADRRSPLHAVHRLDRDTSGLMLFALSTPARAALIELFKKHEVLRAYWAVVHGTLKEPRTIDTQLVRDRGDGLRGSLAAAPAEVSRRAITHVRPIERVGDRFTVVECRLETGRTHQIRIHLSEIGHMICGEKLYLASRAGAERRDESSGAPRQALHSRSLELSHPVTGKRLRFESPVPDDLAKWMEKLRRG